jgi:UDP:flavonoid glycosyltransferase YjiC (YdhE family)
MIRKRLLFFAEGATMAHFVRLLSLADTLDPAEYEVHFYAPRRFSSYLQNRSFATGELATMPGEQFLANIAKGAPMFSLPVLQGYVHQDRALIDRIRPDLVIGDMRLSLPVSAHLTEVPCAVMINAYWSPYARYRAILPEVPLTRIIPPRWLSSLYQSSETFTYRLHLAPVNRLRTEYRLPALPPDLRALYTTGDYVLYPDIPEFVPLRNAPASHYYVGICEWTPPGEKPDWWPRMLGDSRPKVFVSLGSSGPVRVMPQLLRALQRLPVAVLLATSGRDIPPEDLPEYSATLLPFTETASLADVVVSHGGSGGMYPAMAAGSPVLGIPSNADQHLSTATLEENGAGLGVRVEEASERRLHDALERLLLEPKFRAKAQYWAEVYSRYDSGTLFQQFLSAALM